MATQMSELQQLHAGWVRGGQGEAAMHAATRTLNIAQTWGVVLSLPTLSAHTDVHTAGQRMASYLLVFFR